MALNNHTLAHMVDLPCRITRIPSKMKLASLAPQLQKRVENLADLMFTTLLPVAKEDLAMTAPTTHTQKHRKPRGPQREIMKRTKAASWPRKAGCTDDDCMKSRSILPTSKDIATELTKNWHYDPCTMQEWRDKVEPQARVFV